MNISAAASRRPIANLPLAIGGLCVALVTAKLRPAASHHPATSTALALANRLGVRDGGPIIKGQSVLGEPVQRRRMVLAYQRRVEEAPTQAVE